MYCPQCGAEYREGYTECADCRVPLIEKPPRADEPEYRRLVTVFETSNPALIPIAKSVLDDAKIFFLAKGEELQALFAGRIVGPVQLQVDEKDEKEARELLKDLA